MIWPAGKILEEALLVTAKLSAEIRMWFYQFLSKSCSYSLKINPYNFNFILKKHFLNHFSSTNAQIHKNENL